MTIHYQRRPFAPLVILIISLIVGGLVIRPLPRSSLAQTPALQKIESDDSAILQEGTWVNQPAPSASGGSYLYNTGEAALALNFAGPSVEILYVSGPNLGTLAIEIDDTVLRTVITTATEVRYQQSAKIDYLTDENHTLKVYAQAGGVIGVDAFISTPPTPSTTSSVNFGEPSVMPCQPDVYPQMVSVNSYGNPIDDNLSSSAIGMDLSADGRSVAFVVYGRTYTLYDQIYVRDRIACTTTLASAASDGRPASANAKSPTISGDGRYVAFISWAHNLSPIEINTSQAFLFDTETHTTTLASVNSSGQAANASVSDAIISDNGRYLAFRSGATNLVVGGGNLSSLFVRDLQTGEYQVASSGASPCSSCSPEGLDISADGRYVTFAYVSSYFSDEIYVYDFQTHTPTLVATSPQSAIPIDLSQPVISGDGRYVVFLARERHSPFDPIPFGQVDVFVHDLQNNTTTQVNVTSSGEPILAGFINSLSITHDGRYIGFSPSGATYVRDQQTGEIYSVSMRDAHTYPDNPTFALLLAANAPIVAFRAYANNLVAGDTSSDDDIFVNLIYPAPLPTNTETLALFNPITHQISLMDSVADPPGIALTYTANPYAGGQWVMGDWDGDGDRTPGVYAPNGAFRFTNDLGPNATWRGIWFGLMNEAPVAGRFNVGLNHDCLGVVDSEAFPPIGTGFALYYTCELTSGPTPSLEVRWLGVPFPDESPYQGEIQFVAGAFGRPNWDGIAVRRSNLILWASYVPQGAVWLDNAQGWNMAFPEDAYGTLVAGDWNNDSYDTFGFVFQNGDFYWRNDMRLPNYSHAEGWVIMQHTGQPVGTPMQAASWR